MRAFYRATAQFFRQIWADAMLAALAFVPIIMGFAFRFGVPALEGYLCRNFAWASILADWYGLFDLLLCAMTPVMFTAAGALVILDEADAGLCRALAVTPIGKMGYIASRIFVPAALSTIYCAVILCIFKLTDLDFLRIAALCLCSGALGVVVALMIPTLAKNKVEGMAYSKLSGLFMLGIPAAILLGKPVQYVGGVLPTFWMTKLAMGESLFLTIPALITAGIWAALFLRMFTRKRL